MTYVTTPLSGINIADATSTTANFTIGGYADFNNGVRGIYVKAATTITAGDCVIIDGSGNASQITTALTAATAVGAAYIIALANVAITSGSFGWCVIRGSATLNVTAATALGAPLYTTTTAGQLSSTGTNLILGIMVTTATGASGNTPALCSNPVLARGTVGA